MPNAQGQSSGDAPSTQDTQSSFRDMATVVDIHRSLVLLQEKARVSERTTKTHTRKIERLEQWTANLPRLEKDVEKNACELKELGGRHNLEVNGLKLALEKGLNETAQSVRKEISALKDGDIKKLNHYASIGRFICIVLGALITGGVLVKFLWPH